MQMRASSSAYMSTSTSSVYGTSRSRMRAKAYGKRYRRNSGGRYNSAIGVIIGVVLTACLTGIYFYAIQEHDVELSFDQQNELGWQTFHVANRSMYMAKSTRSDLISALPREDWAKVSKRIEWVIFLSHGNNNKIIEERPSVEWTTKMAGIFAGEFMPPNLGIVLFPCGCVVPNAYLTVSSTRFFGLECAMLPGFVFPNKYVAWTDAKPAKNHPSHCIIHPAGWFARHEHKLQLARAAFDVFKENVIAKHAAELSKIEESSDETNNNNNNNIMSKL